MSAGTHERHVQHHFDSSGQQYEASKLGMWIFLATEALMFGGLFCAYAVYRASHPEVFHWGHKLLDWKLGAANTVILILSSFTMAWAVRCAQLGRRRGLVLALVATLVCAAGFLGIKYVEYGSKVSHGLLWGSLFEPDDHYVKLKFGLLSEEEKAAGAGAAAHGDARRGQELFQATCSACHGKRGEGMPRLGKDMRMSSFIADRDDQQMLAFLKVGRQPFDPLNTTGVAMPPRGGNPSLDDAKLLDIVAFVRLIQDEAFAAAEARRTGDERAAVTWHPPPNAHIFFGVYFIMTGLHGLHVVAGMFMLAWLALKAAAGAFGAAYFTPVEIGGLYWHLVDLVWIFLFPLLYLIS